jgi:hypothetical protein
MVRISASALLLVGLNTLSRVLALDNGLAVTPQLGWVRENMNSRRLFDGAGKKN